MISRRACFMPSLGRFKEIFWNQDSLTRQGGTTTWGPRLFRIQAPSLLSMPFAWLQSGCRVNFPALANATTVFSPDFPRPWELRQARTSSMELVMPPPGRGRDRDLLLLRQQAASLDKRSRCRRPSFALAAVSCHWTCSEPRHARPHHTDQHTVSMASHVPSVSVSCRVCCRFGRTALDSRLQAAARREKNGVCQALHPFDGRLLPADLSSLTPPFFPRWLGKFDTRTDVVAKAIKKRREKKYLAGAGHQRNHGNGNPVLPLGQAKSGEVRP